MTTALANVLIYYIDIYKTYISLQNGGKDVYHQQRNSQQS